MGEWMGRIGRMETDFFDFELKFQAKIKKKIRFYPPNPPHPFSHCIGNFPIKNLFHNIHHSTHNFHI
jgi:hypothetical protein